MKAVRFDRYGGIEVLQVANVPMPEPYHGEALVKVKAASINPGEAKIREGLLHAMWPAMFPSRSALIVSRRWESSSMKRFATNLSKLAIAPNFVINPAG